jgi:hypothetical protein
MSVVAALSSVISIVREMFLCTRHKRKVHSNGNTKVFYADQSVLTCPTNACEFGDIEGEFGDFFYTTTELVGKREDNAVLYQLWFKAGAFGLYDEDKLAQSQLTTITRSLDGGQVYRTRSAQGFQFFDPTAVGTPLSVSFYRERKVTEEVFYQELENTFRDYNVLASDQCAWRDSPTGGIVSSGYDPGLDACMAHLEQSFEL